MVGDASPRIRPHRCGEMGSDVDFGDVCPGGLLVKALEKGTHPVFCPVAIEGISAKEGLEFFEFACATIRRVTASLSGVLEKVDCESVRAFAVFGKDEITAMIAIRAILKGDVFRLVKITS
jgi:hypothetical protein